MPHFQEPLYDWLEQFLKWWRRFHLDLLIVLAIAHCSRKLGSQVKSHTRYNCFSLF